MKTWPGILVALSLTACGARTGLDAPPLDYVEPGAPPVYCKDAGDTWIYVVTQQNEILRFEPPAAAFAPIGTLHCPVAAGSTAEPFSMAVDYQGTAYVVFGDGELFTVSTATGVCAATSPPINSSAFTPEFGMGFSSDPGGHAETLFLASTDMPGELGELDTTTFVVQPIGVFSADIAEAELTGTGDGRLFAFGVDQTVAGAHLAELDKTNAAVLNDNMVPTPEGIQDWAFAFWGGDFYFFTSVDMATTQVGRFHPADGSFEPTYATLPTGAVTGAGVSTCAPR